MASFQVSVFFQIVVMLCLQASMSFRIDITPRRYTEESTGAVDIACVMEACDECVRKDVVMLVLSKEGQGRIASVGPKSGFQFDSDHSNKYEGQGAAEWDGSQTFLNVTLPVPRNEDSGRYTCFLVLIANEGYLKEINDTKELTVEIFNTHEALKTMMTTVALLQNQLQAKDLEISDLRNMTEGLMEKAREMSEAIVVLESVDQKFRTTTGNLVYKDRELSKEVLTLKAVDQKLMNTTENMKDKTREMSEAIVVLKSVDQEFRTTTGNLVDKDRELSKEVLTLKAVDQAFRNTTENLVDKVSYRCAFAASLSSFTKIDSFEDVIFDEVITRQGEGYNPSTGVFTAPRDGLYSFNLGMTAWMDKDKCCYGAVQLLVNGDMVGMLRVDVPSDNSDNRYPQSSVSHVTSLAKGDQVKARTDGYKMRWSYRSHFSGFLIQAY